MMPEIDGFALSKLIKQDREICDTKMILWTAYDQKGSVLEAKNNGFSAYITKPVKQNALLEALYNILKNDQISGYIDEAHPELVVKIEQVQIQSKGKILVAEDNKTNQKVATLLLNKMGYSVEIAENGQIAVDMVQANYYDLILMDYNMPVMDGLEATIKIRELDNEHVKAIKIIALTANATSYDMEKCLKSGMNDYISKPINQKELETKVNFWCAKDNHS
jgi:CheY-like chemotaxis protein